MSTKLTTKQKAFINEYMLDFNATAAAGRAGYRGSRLTLASIGSENLSKPPIRKAINQLLTERAMPAIEVIYRLASHARGSMANFVSQSPGGEVTIDLKKALRLGAMDQVKYLSIDERTTPDGATMRRVEISLYDSLSALQILARGFALTNGALSEIKELDSTKLKTSELELWDFIHYTDEEIDSIPLGNGVYEDDFQPINHLMEQVAKLDKASKGKGGNGKYPLIEDGQLPLEIKQLKSSG